MIGLELQVNSWQELRQYRIQSLRRGMEALRAELKSYGASDEHVAMALCHQNEILEELEAQEYLAQKARELSYRDEPVPMGIKRERILRQRPAYDLVFS
jgi:hypothetical protein